MQSMASNLMLFGAFGAWLRPLWYVGVWTAIVLAVLGLLIFVLRLTVPKVLAIARTTAKEALSQPLFYVILAIGVFAILIFPFIPYNTFGEDIKMLKAEGLTLIKILAIIMAVWTASVSIADEIEGRTALTLLSKPIGRRQFIIGKFLGVLAPVVVMFVLLGSLFLATVSYKVVYDAREATQPEPTTAVCRAEMAQVVPGLALALLETVALVSISVAISTRLPMMPNLIICVSIYVLGHLMPMLVNSAAGQIVFVRFVGNFLAAILPVLTHFNMETAISTGQEVSLTYLAWTTLYCALYCTVAMLVALLLFEDRDLA